MVSIDADGLTTRKVNAALREAANGNDTITLVNPDCRHNLCVAWRNVGSRVIVKGDVGYYFAGLNDGGHFEVTGNAGWAVAENMTAGSVTVSGNAGHCAGASLNGGLLYIAGDAAARAGISMKGGILVIGGNAGMMTGFMFQRGRIVIRGDVGNGIGDSMYEGEIFVGGKIRGLGNDAITEAITADDHRWLEKQLGEVGLTMDRDYRKIVAGRKLWHFDKTEWEAWHDV